MKYVRGIYHLHMTFEINDDAKTVLHSEPILKKSPAKPEGLAGRSFTPKRPSERAFST
jgi:hypothetical protein